MKKKKVHCCCRCAAGGKKARDWNVIGGVERRENRLCCREVREVVGRFLRLFLWRGKFYDEQDP